MSRLAIATLSTENLLHNLEVLRKKAQNRNIMAMIKANAYGHGLRSTAMRLDGKVYSLGVASVDEAVALRKVNVKTPITLMSGAFEADDLFVASCQDFQLIFHEQLQIDWLNNIKLPNQVSVWLKVNTGMNRLGFNLESAKAAYYQLVKNPNVRKPVGIISHLACSDEINHFLNKKQLDSFENFVKDLDCVKTIVNSAGIINFSEHLYDVVRPGIALYGISPVKDKTAAELGLKPVMTLQTRLVAISQVKKGESIGYGARYICKKDMQIGVIAMGYGDGYPRSAKDGTPILVNNQLCQLVGRVSMDMATIDLSNCPNAQIGDPVILWGEGLPIEEVAKYTDNVPYDIICGVQQRVKFYWTLEK